MYKRQAYAYEVATIIRHGIDEMWGQNLDVFHYVMLYNENQHCLLYTSPSPRDRG